MIPCTISIWYGRIRSDRRTCDAASSTSKILRSPLSWDTARLDCPPARRWKGKIDILDSLAYSLPLVVCVVVQVERVPATLLDKGIHVA